MRKEYRVTMIALACLFIQQYAFANQNAYAQQSADNTAINKFDRGVGKLTAQNQSNQESDITLTRHLRQKLLAQKNLSLNAQNIKIISRNGFVRLRGPVNSDQEKSLIGNLAQQQCGNNVANELEIKFPTNNR